MATENNGIIEQRIKVVPEGVQEARQQLDELTDTVFEMETAVDSPIQIQVQANTSQAEQSIENLLEPGASQSFNVGFEIDESALQQTTDRVQEQIDSINQTFDSSFQDFSNFQSNTDFQPFEIEEPIVYEEFEPDPSAIQQQDEEFESDPSAIQQREEEFELNQNILRQREEEFELNQNAMQQQDEEFELDPSAMQPQSTIQDNPFSDMNRPFDDNATNFESSEPFEPFEIEDIIDTSTPITPQDMISDEPINIEDWIEPEAFTQQEQEPASEPTFETSTPFGGFEVDEELEATPAPIEDNTDEIERARQQLQQEELNSLNRQRITEQQHEQELDNIEQATHRQEVEDEQERQQDLRQQHQELERIQEDTTNETRNHMNNLSDSIGKTFVYLNQGIQLMQRLFGYADQIATFYDSYTNSNARLNYVNDESVTGISDTAFQSMVSDMASRARMEYAESANIISRFMQTDSFDSVTEAMDFTETMAKSLRVTGSSTQETISTIRQLSQALTKGYLNGDEYRSVSENSPMIISALAEVLGTDKAGVKEASTAGQITTDVIKEAIASMQKEVDDAFSEMPVTFQDLKTRMQNELGQFLSTTNSGQALMTSWFNAFEDFIDYLQSSDGQETLTNLTNMVTDLFTLGVAFVDTASPFIEVLAQHPQIAMSAFLGLKGFNALLGTNLIASLTSAETETTLLATSLGGLKTALGGALSAVASFLSNPTVLGAGLGLGLAGTAYAGYKTSEEATIMESSLYYDGYDRESLQKQGYTEKEAIQLEELYARSNQLLNEMNIYEGNPYEEYLMMLNYTSLGNKQIKNDEDFTDRKSEYDEIRSKIDELSYLDKEEPDTNLLSEIADNTKQTADNTAPSDFVSKLQEELRYAQQQQTLAQIIPNQISVTVNTPSQNVEDIIGSVAEGLRQQLEVTTTS